MAASQRIPAQVHIPFQRSVIYHGLRDGHGQYLVVTFAANADTPIQHGLGRIPIGYIPLRVPSTGGDVVDGSLNGADWTPSTVVLQAKIAGTYTVWLC